MYIINNYKAKFYFDVNTNWWKEKRRKTLALHQEENLILPFVLLYLTAK